jgi:predicted dehydrogenase
VDRKIRVGIIGAGWWAAHTHAPALKATGDVEIVAACRRSADRLKEFAELVQVPQTFTDHEEMLDRVDLDAVVVCSPHAMHAGHVKAALERGLPVLTDKPLSITVEEGEELIALAAAKGVPLAVFFGHC